MRGRVRGDDLGHVLIALVDVGHEQHRLRGQRLEQAHDVRRLVGDGHGPRRPPLVERLDHGGQPALLGDRVRVAAARLAHDALVAALGLLEVGVDQLGLDRVDVARR
ncbi:MAG: hypothetical protein MUF56_03765, partial [Solirubrobacteraceae bacterium]|nr:hypothetical protein [Solirubrobacteraceae bacterium]